MQDILQYFSKMGKENRTVEVKEITDAEFESLIKNNEFVAIDFFAEWCMPCLMQEPVIDELAQTYAEKIVFAKINVDENHETATRYKIMSIPTLLFFKNGQVAERVVGTLPYEALKEKLQKNIK